LNDWLIRTKENLKVYAQADDVIIVDRESREVVAALRPGATPYFTILEVADLEIVLDLKDMVLTFRPAPSAD
jgi:hypothetical protein